MIFAAGSSCSSPQRRAVRLDNAPKRQRPGNRAGRSSSSHACATSPATGTTTRRSPPTSRLHRRSTRRSRSTKRKSSSPPASTELLSFPFVFMTGHKLVRFSAAERENLRRFADAGGLLFSDDCNHDVNGLYARSFEQEMRAVFPGRAAGQAAGLASDLPQLLHLQGRAAADVARAEWLGRQHRPRVPERRRAPRPPRGPLQQQGLRLRVGLRLAQQAISARGQHQVRRQHRRLRDDVNAGATDRRGGRR